MTARKRPTDRLEDEVLSRLELSRRELVRRLVTGTAFAVPVVASFDMASLTVSSADATTPNQVDFLPPAITSDITASLTAGEPGAATVTTTGTPSPTIAQSGALPRAVTFSDNGDGTATLAGTPAAGTGGAYPLTITATNGHPPDAAQQFTLAVDEPVTITSPLSVTFTAGQQGTFTITTAGFPTPMLSLAGALPQGVTFIDNGDGTGTLAGMPAADAGGSYPLQITAATETAPPLTRALALTVDQAPAITSPPQAAFTIGRPARFVVTTTGFPVPRIAASGALPAGVVLTDNGNGTASLSGTPAVGSGGSHRLTLSAVGTPGAPATQAFALLVSEQPVPVVFIERPRAGASYRRGQVVKASYSASSAAGISSIHGTVPDGTPVDTARGGGKSFAVTATDADGLSTTAHVAYAVEQPSNRFTLTNLDVGQDGTFAFGVEVPGPGTIDVLITAWDSNLAAHMTAAATLLEPAPGRFVFARAHQRPHRHGMVHLHVPPNGRGRRLVHHHRHAITLRLWVSYTPHGGITRSEGRYGLTLPKMGIGR